MIEYNDLNIIYDSKYFEERQSQKKSQSQKKMKTRTKRVMVRWVGTICIVLGIIMTRSVTHAAHTKVEKIEENWFQKLYGNYTSIPVRSSTR